MADAQPCQPPQRPVEPDDIRAFLDSGVLSKDEPITIVELGAHVGMHTRLFRWLFPKARIWAFEPDPRNIAEIKRLGVDKSVHIVEAAIGDHDGTMTMHLSSGKVKAGDPRTSLSNWTFSSSLKQPRGHLKRFQWVKFPHTAKVKVITLDTFVREQGIDVIDFLWADVQGAEDMMIAGGQQALARTRYLFTEYSDEQLYEGQIGLEEILRRLPGGPGAWDVHKNYGDDALLRNRAVATPK